MYIHIITYHSWAVEERILNSPIKEDFCRQVKVKRPQHINISTVRRLLQIL